MGGTYCANDLGSNDKLVGNGDVWSGPNDCKGWQIARSDGAGGDEYEYCSWFVGGRT